ncbi:UNVERIFIED_CONTAM: hypothetical protein Sangu_0055200 [Sesamum angustifolium]|uniref:Uncharacterized protein n=1 Tax=Sesamum angustifolium TaxID=2727405 RepID=A0AAW2RII5_9LAMI
MAGKSNRGKNRKGLQQSALNSSEQSVNSAEQLVNSSEQSVSSDAHSNRSSSAVHANGDTSLNESNETKSEVKDQDNAPNQHPAKQGGSGIHGVHFCSICL